MGVCGILPQRQPQKSMEGEKRRYTTVRLCQEYLTNIIVSKRKWSRAELKNRARSSDKQTGRKIDRDSSDNSPIGLSVFLALDRTENLIGKLACSD